MPLSGDDPELDRAERAGHSCSEIPFPPGTGCREVGDGGLGERPNEQERVVAPDEYLRQPIRIPVHPVTVGDHLRLRRLNLKMLQRDLAKKLGVETSSIFNWEANTGGSPRPQYFPAIIEFLGYNPLPPAKTWAERLVRGRMSQGLSQKEFAGKLEVDPSTLAKWERREREPCGAFAARAELFLASEGKLIQARRAG